MTHPSSSIRTVLAGLLFCLAITTRQSPAAAAEARDLTTTVYYVSTRGSDQWSGRRAAPAVDHQDGPFATLTAARDAIRRLKAAHSLPGAAKVIVLEGTYHLSEPFVLTPEDTGSEKRPITYTAYPGHHPVLSGGKVIQDWKPAAGKILQADLPEVKAGRWKFRQLFFRGQRQTRARWPNQDPADPLCGGWAFVAPAAPEDRKDPATHRYAADQAPRHWSHPEQAEVNVFPWYCWVNDIVPLKAADAAGQTITLASSPHYDWMPLVPGNRFCVENVLEELDQPGEWCLCADTGTLYFWPPGDMMPGDVIAPVLDTLIELRGAPNAPLRHITISGLTFSHTRSPFPDQLHDNFHAPTRRGAGITLEHCDGCRIEDNRFVLLGGDGVRLQGGNARNEVVGNAISHVGGAGVALASRDEAGNAGDTKDFADQALLRSHSSRYPKLVRNVVSDNDIHHCGRLKNCGGVQLYGVNSVDTVVSHNRIHHMPDKGLTMQDGFGRCIVEYNDMDQLGQEIADTGGIMINRWFVLRDDPELASGNVIRFNRIRNCIGCGAYAEKRPPKGEGDRTTSQGRIWTPYYTWGIYFDNSGMENTVYGNIIVSAVLGAVGFPVGAPQNNRVENNIFVGSSGNQVDLRMGGENNLFARNIISYADPQAMLLAANANTRKAVAQCDYNVYFPAAKQEPRVRGIGSLSDWKKRGFDQHSLVADPLFVDDKSGDYRLRPESPAFGLGFRPIPVDKIGPRPKRPGSSLIAAGDPSCTAAIHSPLHLPPDPIACERIPLGEPDDYKPCIARLPDGELLLTAFHPYGREENKVLEQTLLFRSRDGGKNWRPPEKLSLLGREPYLTVLPDGVIFITGHLLANDVRNRWGYTCGFLHRSADRGRTWESIRIESEAIKPKATNHSSRNVLRLADGTLLVGVDYGGGGGPYLMWRSADGGKTWDKTQQCAPADFPSKYGFFGGETWLWQAKSGKIWALVRTDSNELPIQTRPIKGKDDQSDHFILFSSSDQGRTFGRVRDFGDYGEMYMSLLRLQDQRLLLTFTVRALHPPLGVRAIPGVETDDGFIFNFAHDHIMLDTQTGSRSQGGGFGPTVQWDDGVLVTSCSYRGKDDKTHVEVVRWRLPSRKK